MKKKEKVRIKSATDAAIPALVAALRTQVEDVAPAVAGPSSDCEIYAILLQSIKERMDALGCTPSP